MCAACVAQGVAYVGGALTTLQYMGARARSKRLRSAPVTATATDAPAPTDLALATQDT